MYSTFYCNYINSFEICKKLKNYLYMQHFNPLVAFLKLNQILHKIFRYILEQYLRVSINIYNLKNKDYSNTYIKYYTELRSESFLKRKGLIIAFKYKILIILSEDRRDKGKIFTIWIWTVFFIIYFVYLKLHLLIPIFYTKF